MAARFIFISLFLLMLLGGGLLAGRRLQARSSRPDVVERELAGLKAFRMPRLYYYLTRPRRLDVPVIGRMALAPQTVLLRAENLHGHDTLLLLHDAGELLPPGFDHLLWQGRDSSTLMSLVTKSF